MREALRALQRSGDYRVKTWASALGMSRHALRRLFARATGFTPEEVAWEFLNVRVRREVAHGRNDAQIATSVGYATGFALRRAYARRRRPFPRQ